MRSARTDWSVIGVALSVCAVSVRAYAAFPADAAPRSRRSTNKKKKTPQFEVPLHGPMAT